MKSEDLIPGGKGDDKTPIQIAEKHNVPLDHINKQLEVGKLVEKEHVGNDIAKATEIAIDHLWENPNYYTILIQSGLADEKEAIEKFKELFPTIKINEIFSFSARRPGSLIFKAVTPGGKYSLEGRKTKYFDLYLYSNGHIIERYSSMTLPEFKNHLPKLLALLSRYTRLLFDPVYNSMNLQTELKSNKKKMTSLSEIVTDILNNQNKRSTHMKIKVKDLNKLIEQRVQKILTEIESEAELQKEISEMKKNLKEVDELQKSIEKTVAIIKAKSALEKKREDQIIQFMKQMKISSTKADNWLAKLEEVLKYKKITPDYKDLWETALSKFNTVTENALQRMFEEHKAMKAKEMKTVLTIEDFDLTAILTGLWNRFTKIFKGVFDFKKAVDVLPTIPNLPNK